MIFTEPLQRRQNASLGNSDSSPGTKKKRSQGAESGQQGVGGGHNHHFVFSQKGGILLMLQRFNENQWRPLTAFPLKVVDNVSSSGSGAGIAASSHWGSALKGIKVSNLYEYFKHTVLTIPGISGL